MRTAYRLGRIIGVLTALLVLGGCSALKLGYATLPEFSYWWLDGYIDFTAAQAPRAREDLARLHHWHRGTELPRYAEVLERLERLAPGDITAEQVCGVVDEVRQRVRALADRAEPAVVTLALTLGPGQLDHLARRHARDNEAWRKEWVDRTPAERQQQRMKQLVERLEKVYGPLQTAQLQQLREGLARSIFDPQRVLAERQRRQADALQTLQRMLAPGLALEEARRLWRGYVARVQHSPDAAWQQHAQALMQENCAGLAAVHASTTAAQRQAAAARLRSYQRELAELAAQP